MTISVVRLLPFTVSYLHGDLAMSTFEPVRRWDVHGLQALSPAEARQSAARRAVALEQRLAVQVRAAPRPRGLRLHRDRPRYRALRVPHSAFDPLSTSITHVVAIPAARVCEPAHRGGYHQAGRTGLAAARTRSDAPRADMGERRRRSAGARLLRAPGSTARVASQILTRRIAWWKSQRAISTGYST